MENITLNFYGNNGSERNNLILNCHSTLNNEIYISIYESDFVKRFICLDRKTAIKLHKELKRQISFLESEVNNG